MNAIPTKYNRFIGLILGATFLSLNACGGGGSNSGGGDEAKTYTGSETLTLSSPGVASENIGAFSLRILITGASVVVTNSDGGMFTGALADNSFSATGNTVAFSQDGVSCAASMLTYKGEVNGGTITGSTRGVINCRANGFNIPITQTGTFRVSLIAKEFAKSDIEKSDALAGFALGE